MDKPKKSPELHLHSMDLYDSDNRPDAVCRRLKELGAEGLCLTQHGVLSGIEPMRDAAAEYGLKFVPGIEAYYGEADDLMQMQHLLLLSKDYQGYHAIWKMVSDRRAQDAKGRARIKEELLMEYLGPKADGYDHVIATSACINGVIAVILRANEILFREIEKIERKSSEYTGMQERAEKCAEKLRELDEKIASATELRDQTKALAETKFVKRQKSVQKLLEAGDPAYESELASLNHDVQEAEQAKTRLGSVKADLESLKKSRSAYSKEYKALSEKAAKAQEYAAQIQNLQNQVVDDAILYENAKKEVEKFQKIFGKKNFYIEIQNHGIDTEAKVYPILVQIAREMGIPVVATNDVHMVNCSKEEILKRKILNSMRFQKWEGPSVGDDQMYIKTDDELREWLLQVFDEDVVNEAMSNIQVVFDRCNVEFPEETHYPVFPSIDGKTSDEMLWDAIQKGVQWRFPDGISREYQDRLEYEYRVITQMGYSDYHLIVKDFLEYGRALAPVPDEMLDQAPLTTEEAKKWVEENGWEGGFTIGPGRGSAAGSLICYCLGITSFDPIKYGLLFERFLNPERISMPDIDSDISQRVRPKAIEYVKNKFGIESVCGIMTTNAIAPKGAIRDVAKYYGQAKWMNGGFDAPETKYYGLKEAERHFLPLADEMAKKIPTEVGLSFDTKLSEDMTVFQMLQKEYADNADALQLLTWAKAFEGCFTAYGAHAAGVVISDGNPVSDYIPLRWNNSMKSMTTQVDMVKVEEKGLLKMDFLGLITLDVLTDTIRMIRDSEGVIIDPLTIPLDDKRVFDEIFHPARTNSVFQFESDGMKNMLKRFRPDSFEDLIILVSMFRPGPIQYLDGVIDVKTKGAEIHYLCPELIPILGKTYGAIVYQEQVMEIFQKLAGYTLGGADQVRRYMSKKKMDKLVHEKEAFIHGDPERNIPGCVGNGIDAEAAEKLFEQMTDFAKYAFNKSHAAAYALNAYYTAWFKLYYPAQFLAAAMRWANSDKIPGLMNEAKSFGVEILPPDVNLSQSKFTVEYGKIRFALSSIKNVASEADVIVKEREENGAYVSLKDFFYRTSVKKDAAFNLIRAGALDEFYESRLAMCEVIQPYKDSIKKCKDKQSDIQVLEEKLDILEKAIELLQKQNRIKTQILQLIPDFDVKKQKKSWEKSLQTAKETVVGLKFAVDTIQIPSIKDSVADRMIWEKELLGAFVTAHPLDEYEKDQGRGTCTIESLSAMQEGEDVTVFGVISNVEEKVTKRGDRMAIIEVDDYTGTVKICLFPQSYERYKAQIQVANAFLFTGKVKKDDYNEDHIEVSIILKSLKGVTKKSARLLIDCISIQAFREKEEWFKEHYLDENGMKASLHAKDEDKIYPLDYRVKKSLEKMKGVKAY